LVNFGGGIYYDGFGDGGSLVIWVLWVSEVLVAEVIVIDSGDSIAGLGTKCMFAVEVYQRVPSIIDEFNRSRAFVSEVVPRNIISGLSSYSIPLC
jgi:hypothetical protein